MDSNINTVEIIQSKNGFPIPLVSGVYLHSVYNPQKEAESFIEDNIQLILQNNKILVLGLGLGYHLEELSNKMFEKYRDNFSIFVLEPNVKLYQEFIALNSHKAYLKNIKFFINSESSELYANIELANFLTQKPSILPHPPSFNLNRAYFKNVLTHKSSKLVVDICKTITNEEIISLLYNLGEEVSIDEALKKIEEQNQVTNKLDFLLLAYNNIEKNNKTRSL